MIISESQIHQLIQEIYGGNVEMSHEEKQALYKIIDKIKNGVMSKMMRDEEDGKDHFGGSTLVYVQSVSWKGVENKPIVIRKVSQYMKDQGLIGKWIDQNNIFVKW